MQPTLSAGAERALGNAKKLPLIGRSGGRFWAGGLTELIFVASSSPLKPDQRELAVVYEHFENIGLSAGRLEPEDLVLGIEAKGVLDCLEDPAFNRIRMLVEVTLRGLCAVIGELQFG